MLYISYNLIIFIHKRYNWRITNEIHCWIIKNKYPFNLFRLSYIIHVTTLADNFVGTFVFTILLDYIEFIIYIKSTSNVRFTDQVNLFNIYNAYNELCLCKTSYNLVIYVSIFNYISYILIIT